MPKVYIGYRAQSLWDHIVQDMAGYGKNFSVDSGGHGRRGGFCAALPQACQLVNKTHEVVCIVFQSFFGPVAALRDPVVPVDKMCELVNEKTLQDGLAVS